jgi:cytochrome P450 family 6/cytochrome P450 family 28
MGRQLFNFEDPVLGLKFILISIIPSITKLIKIRFSTEDSEKFFINLMHQAIQLREKTKITRDDYLAYLIGLKNKKEISELDMAAHGVTFFIDGFETSSVAIGHALYEVSWKGFISRNSVEKYFDIFWINFLQNVVKIKTLLDVT